MPLSKTNIKPTQTSERADLKNLMGFQFHNHGRIALPESRLQLPSGLVNRQIRAILA